MHTSLISAVSLPSYPYCHAFCTYSHYTRISGPPAELPRLKCAFASPAPAKSPSSTTLTSSRIPATGSTSSNPPPTTPASSTSAAPTTPTTTPAHAANTYNLLSTSSTSGTPGSDPGTSPGEPVFDPPEDGAGSDSVASDGGSESMGALSPVVAAAFIWWTRGHARLRRALSSHFLHAISAAISVRTLNTFFSRFDSNFLFFV
ncbi:hypothetical protein V8E53_003802 [Lactarius tabidus]